jgi:hypothetical protein
MQVENELKHRVYFPLKLEKKIVILHWMYTFHVHMPTVNITILFGKKPLDICNLGVYNSPHTFVEAYTYI